jgi:cation transport ATPase
MTQKKYLKIFLVSALVFIALGGLMIHYGFHPVSGSRARMVNYVPFIAGLITIFIVTTLFMYKKLIPFAYLMNGMLCIIGIIAMTVYSLTPRHIPLWADIITLLALFCLGKLLFELEMTIPSNLDALRRRGRFLRYPNMGYWVVHLVTLSIVFALGHILWK